MSGVPLNNLIIRWPPKAWKSDILNLSRQALLCGVLSATDSTFGVTRDRWRTHLKLRVNVTGSAESLLFFLILVSAKPQPLDALSAHDLLLCR